MNDYINSSAIMHVLSLPIVVYCLTRGEMILNNGDRLFGKSNDDAAPAFPGRSFVDWLLGWLPDLPERTSRLLAGDFTDDFRHSCDVFGKYVINVFRYRNRHVLAVVTLREYAYASAMIQTLKKPIDAMLRWSTTESVYATVVFIDVCNYSGISEHMSPDALRTFLSRFFDLVNRHAVVHGVRQVERIGDCYVGISTKALSPPHASKAAAFSDGCLDSPRALERRRLSYEEDSSMHFAEYARYALLFAVEVLRSCAHIQKQSAEGQVSVRVGIHSGACNYGADESTSRFLVVGDTMNLASRMQTSAPANSIRISSTTNALLSGLPGGLKALLPEDWEVVEHAHTAIKGKPSQRTTDIFIASNSQRAEKKTT